MRNSHRHRFTAALAVGALGLVACSAGAGNGGTSAPSEAQEDASVSIGLAAVPANLDFTTTGGAAIFEALLYNVYEGLVRLDEEGAVEPLLAESWEISEDGLEYTFNLREDVTFHDGTEFDAETVKFSLERLDEWTANTPDNLAAIDHVEVHSPTEATVVLSEPTMMPSSGWPVHWVPCSLRIRWMTSLLRPTELALSPWSPTRTRCR